MLWNMISNLDFTVASQYFGLASTLLFDVLLFAGAVVTVAFWERRFVSCSPTRSRYRPVVCLAALATFLLQGTILLNSRYLAAVAQFHSFDTSSEPRGFRLGPAVAYANRILDAQAELRADGGSAGPATEAGKAVVASVGCDTCPDLVVVHLKSVFDPRILAIYGDRPGYLHRMNLESPLTAVSGDLVVNIFGGSSWISEFEVLCGIHHTLFGDGGTFPHSFVAPFMTGCAPASLKAIGYRTSAIYTPAHPFFAESLPGFEIMGSMSS